MSSPDFKDITDEQVNKFSILKNLDMKVLVTKCVLVAFFIILAFLILQIAVLKSTWQQTAIVGAIEGILGGTMYPLVRHYLPAVQNAKRAEENERKSKAKAAKARGSKTDPPNLE